MTRRGLIALSVAATTLLVAGAALTIAASGPSATAACLAAFRAGNDDGQCYAAEASGSVVAAFLRAARGVAPEGLDVAADAGLAPALAVRALGQLSRADVSPQARAFALTDLRASARQGYAPAQTWLAVALLAGEAGEGRETETEAADWLGRAARQGSADAQFLLAGLHRTGRGVVADRQRMRDLYHEAAQRGHAGAAYNLAVDYYLYGDAATADMWLAQSAAGGFGPALTARGRLFEQAGESAAAAVHHALAARFSIGARARAAQATADGLAAMFDAKANESIANRVTELEAAIRGSWTEAAEADKK